MTDEQLERRIDREVQRRLQTDRRYQNAENGHDQAAAEDEITAEVEREILDAGMSDQRRLRAAGLLEQLAATETDLGAKGYSEGMAARLRSRREYVDAAYVEGLERAIAERERQTT